MYNDEGTFFGISFRTVNISKVEEQTFDCWHDGLIEMSKERDDSLGHTRLAIAIRVLQQLEYYFAVKRKEKNYMLHDDKSSQWLSKLFIEQLSSKNNTIKRKRAIGAIVECLYQLSDAEANELKTITKEAMMLWLGKSKSTIITSYELFRNTHPENTPNHPTQLIATYSNELYALLDERNPKYFVVKESKVGKREEQREKLRLAFKELCEKIEWLRGAQLSDFT